MIMIQLTDKIDTEPKYASLNNKMIYSLNVRKLAVFYVYYKINLSFMCNVL
jgi:hypothetical protein